MEVMPIPCPHFKITIVKRSQGQSAVAGAAYQSGERLFSEYDQKTKFYNKKKELVHAEIMLPSHAPPGFADRATLWNAVEAVENQWNSQLARRIVLAFPVEVPKEQYASSRGIRKKFRQDAAGAEKAFGFAHRGTDKQLLVFEAPIDLLSFIELFPKNWQQHNYLSLGGVSGKALRQFLSERPDVERVFLCLDADKAGEDACKRLAGLLPDTVSVTRIQPCMKDWNDVLVHRAEIPNRNYFKSIVLKEPSKPETVKIIRMSDVELTPVEWLWKPYLPFGKLSVLQGNPGEGKTYFAMHLAAACTNGKLLPNMERMEPFNVIYQTAEDGLGDTVKPRLIEAGADLDRVLIIDDSEVQLTLSDERIEKAIIENNARLVIIDPIQAYLGADVDMNRANEVVS